MPTYLDGVFDLWSKVLLEGPSYAVRRRLYICDL